MPVRDAAALAAAIARLQDDPVLAPVWCGRPGRALAEFDETIVIDRTIAVYRELLPTP